MRMCRTKKKSNHFDGDLRAFHLREVSAGLYDSDHKKQNQQRIAYRLKCAVNVYDDIPYRAALELFGRLRKQKPYFTELVIPRR